MRVRHVLTAVIVLSLIISSASLVAGSRSRGSRANDGAPEATIERDDLLAELNPTGKAGSLAALADELLANGKTDQAVAVLNQIVAMGLPDTREADKIVTAAYLSLGHVYADAHPAKAVVFYTRAIEHMDVDEDIPVMVDTMTSVSRIHAALGNTPGAARYDTMAHDASLGLVDIGAVSQSELAPLDAGDDTCDFSVPVSLPYVEQMSIKPAFDKNWRDFTITSNAVVRIETLDADTAKDTQLELWGGCDINTPIDFIAADDDGGDGLLSLIEVCLTPGQYWVEVGAFSDRTPEDFTFAITEVAECQPLQADSYEPDNELSQANRIKFRHNWVFEDGKHGRDRTAVQRHSIYPALDVDVVKFWLTKPNRVRIETFGVDGENVDTVIGLSNWGAYLYAVNDDKEPGDFGSRLDFCLSPGTYYVPMIGAFTDSEFWYDIVLDVNHSCLFENEPNASCDLATPIGVGELWSGVQLSGGIVDNDYYSFSLAEEQYVVIETSGYNNTDVDTFLEVYDGCPGNLIGADDDGGPGFLSRLEGLLPAGTYYVNSTVSPFDVGDSWPYDLQVTATEPPPMESEPNNSCAAANPVAFGDALQASIDPVGDQDFFLLNVPVEGFVEIETDGPSGDTAIQITGPDGTPLIGCDDDGGNVLWSKWSCCLPAGDYCVGVKDWNNNSVISNYTVDFRDMGSCTPVEPLECPIVDPYDQCNPF